MNEERFNPLFIIGKTRREGVEYLDKFGIIYKFESCGKSYGSISLFEVNKINTHFYKIYDFNSKNENEDIIISFEGYQKSVLYNNNIYNNNNNINNINFIC